MPRSNPAFRYPIALERDHARSRAAPAPSVEAFDAVATLLVHPVALGLWDRHRGPRLRQRVLTLPVLVGILLSLVWRQVPSVSVLTRVLAREPLLWVEPITISQQAIAKRLETMPAQLFADLWQELTPLLQQRAAQRPAFHSDLLARLHPAYARVWVLGGTLVAVLDVGSHLPVQVWVDASPTVNDRAILPKLHERTPAGTLVVLDRGFTTFASFAHLSSAGSAVVGRWSAHWKGDVVETLSSGTTQLDQLVRVGLDRQVVRRIGRFDNGQWHWWVTTECDPGRLPADQVIALYAQRWRIEEAFLQIKRLLNLSYLWGSTANAVALQVWTTVLVYGVLVDLCGELGQALAVPAERISVEMTFRSLYHYARACQHGEPRELVAWLSDPKQGDLGLVKRQRKRRNPDTLAITDELKL